MLSKLIFGIIVFSTVFLTSCLKEIDGPINVELSPFPKVELNLDQANEYKAKIYYQLASRSIVKTSDNLSWHIAFANDPTNMNKVIMNYAFGKSCWGTSKNDTIWSRSIEQAFFDTVRKPIYANYYDSAADLFSRGLFNVYYLSYPGVYFPSIKFQILTYTPTEVSFRYANIDGSNEKTLTIPLNFSTHYTYVSLVTGTVQDIEPTDKMSWDFEVTRYTTFVTDFSQPQMYGVAGLISNPSKNVKIAKLENVNLENISESSLSSYNYLSSLSAVGHDWKKFSNGGPDGFYSILPRSYVVSVAGKKHGLQFVSFTKTVDKKPVNGFITFLQRDF